MENSILFIALKLAIKRFFVGEKVTAELRVDFDNVRPRVSLLSNLEREDWFGPRLVLNCLA